jgi:hypothetical protein
MRYRGLDTAAVIREVFESAGLMGRKVLKTLGVEEEKIARIEAAYRVRDKERLRVQAEKGVFSEEARTLFSINRPLLDDDQ